MFEVTPEINALTHQIIGVCMKVHRGLGPGFPEDYYQKALEYEFQKQAFNYEPQKPLQVFYEDALVGLNYLDFLIDEKVILEIKSTHTLTDVHKFQMIKYFACSEYKVGLLVNFGPAKLQFERLLPPMKLQER